MLQKGLGHRYAPLVQEHQPLREHQPHPKERGIHQDELLFYWVHYIQPMEQYWMILLLMEQKQKIKRRPWTQQLRSLPLYHQDLDNPA